MLFSLQKGSISLKNPSKRVVKYHPSVIYKGVIITLVPLKFCYKHRYTPSPKFGE
jgi:hypothetical protein